MGYVLGEYKSSVPLSLITQKRQSIGGTSSEVACLRGTRYAVIQEPSESETMNEGVFKELTGEDPITCRELFRSAYTFDPQFNLVICANVFLNIKTTDDGTWRRVKVVEFGSKFVDNPAVVDEEEFRFLKNPKLKDTMKTWSECVLHMLTEYAFKNQGVVGSYEVVDCATARYRLSQDRVGQFIKDNIIPADGTCSESKERLSQEFKHWFEVNFKYSIKGKELFNRLDKDYVCNSTRYFGVRLKNGLDIEKERFKSPEDLFIESFDTQFEITHDYNTCFIKCSRIQEWAKNKSLAIQSSKAINDILKSKYGMDSKDKNVCRNKKIGGKVFHYWYGIRERGCGVESGANTDTEGE
jgi:hypothetical protein